MLQCNIRMAFCWLRTSAVNFLHHLLRRAARLARAGARRAMAFGAGSGEAPDEAPRPVGPAHTPSAPPTPPVASPSPAAPRAAEAAATAAGVAAPLDVAQPGVPVPLRPAEAPPRPPPTSPPGAPPGALGVAQGSFRADSFVHAAGRRAYRLFVPPGASSGSRALLVMLHGCKQDAADFAAGTQMNERALALGWVVLYPEQSRGANGLGCWNWFKAGHQRRGLGEPAILAGMVRHVVATEGIDARRVYVAGLSAGGAMAATLASTYPELFAAVGIHSGLPYAAAHDAMSAFQAMRAGPVARLRAAPARARLPTIVFHGDLDDTVHPHNGEALVAGAWPDTPIATEGAPARSWTRVERGRVPDGRAYTRTVHTAPDGRIHAEHWLVHDAGHAWCGGSPAGSYTDPAGPDASSEMLRFFAAHRRQAEVAASAA